jgi:hypothetical protein
VKYLSTEPLLGSKGVGIITMPCKHLASTGGAPAVPGGFLSRAKRVMLASVRPAAAVADAPQPLSVGVRPDANGRFGKFGGKYVPETLIPALQNLEIAYKDALSDQAFLVRRLLRHAIRPGGALNLRQYCSKAARLSSTALRSCCRVHMNEYIQIVLCRTSWPRP